MVDREVVLTCGVKFLLTADGVRLIHELYELLGIIGSPLNWWLL